MATKKKTGSKDLGKQIGVRLTEADHARLERLAVHLSLRRSPAAALLVGLDVIEGSPGSFTARSRSDVRSGVGSEGCRR
jgi:hypothetical protein